MSSSSAAAFGLANPANCTDTGMPLVQNWFADWNATGLKERHSQRRSFAFNRFPCGNRKNGG
jgi:hypothetical protein